ncbi:MAG TPA: transglycosylase SLT domain-containing protein [Angustibacter sp.]|nr:transglycosylase SLT domain-containing protein [Angustibacter sp.]
MSDLSVLSRIDEIRTIIGQLAPPQVATAASASGATSGGSDFAATLAAAQRTSGATGGALVAGDVGGMTPLGALAPSAGQRGRLDGDAVVADARRYLGVPYRWGGTDPSSGLDCSGLVQRVFNDLGISLPRTVAQQKDVGTAVPSMDEARPGDLLVFGSHHIGIYVGGGKMLAAPKAGDVVKIQSVYDTPTRIRRVVPAADAVGAPGIAGDVRPSALRANASRSTAFDGLFAAASARYGLPAGLLRAVAQAESGFDPRAVSDAGAVGLMQLMPGTARQLGVDPSKPAQAVDGAARLLRQHLDDFGSVPLALAAYNAGPGAVRKYDGIPPYPETQAYVRRVTSTMEAAR